MQGLCIVQIFSELCRKLYARDIQELGIKNSTEIGIDDRDGKIIIW